MMNRATLLTLLLAAVLAIGLFKVKYEVIALEAELERLGRDIVADQQTVHVLKAEWSHLNEPERLRELARRHLDLAPIGPGQLARFEDLPGRDEPGVVRAGGGEP